MDDLASCLAGLGLSQYTQTFERNGIDARSLPLLSDAELGELGVLLGHRKLLRRALEPLAAAAAAAPESSAALPERRQLTVLFCDLVGSTALAQSLDAELLRDVLHTYQRDCGKVISHYDGHVAQYLGDGLMVYFGFPHAHEDDAERAVRAALDIVAAVHRIESAAPLAVRIGIATGEVVVGETGAGDASVPKAAVGSTPNLAARLQALAEADQIVVAPGTRRLLGGAFEFEELGEVALKGITGSVRAARIIGASRADGRFEAARSRGVNLTPLVGRERELAQLLSAWQQTCAGQGRVVLIGGEPGIGKSRLLQALRESIDEAPHVWLRYQCSPYDSGSAFHPIVSQLERAAGIDRDDGASVRLDKLEAVLKFQPDRMPSAAPLLAALLSLPTDRYPAQLLSPQKRNELTKAALVEQLLNVATRAPVLMVVEDAHWIDPSTLATLSMVVEQMSKARVLLVVTHRPEFGVPWHDSHVDSLHLRRLSHHEGAVIVARLTGGRALPKALLEQIVAHTDGVPLFVEELTKSVLESGLLRAQGGQWALDGPLPPLAVPTTLQDSLMARLDRLSPVKEIAQIGACIGREFSYELLAAVTLWPEPRLRSALDQLVASELVFCRGAPPSANYTFKHALVQDSAYASLLKSRRQQTHARIATVLRTLATQDVASQPELLARHCTEAGLIDEALPLWLQAAQRAAHAARNAEALTHVASGLAVVARGSAGLRENLEVALLSTGAVCHFGMTGYASEPAASFLARVEAVLDRVTDRRVLFVAQWAIGVQAWVRGNLPKAVVTYERMASLAEQSGDRDELVFAYCLLGALVYHVGQYERTRRLLEFVLEHYDLERHLPYAVQFGTEFKTAAHAWLGLMYADIGQLDKALAHCQQLVDHARAIAYPFALTLALSQAAAVMASCGFADRAVELARQCIELCESQNLPYWRSIALIHLGRGEWLRGDHLSAVEHIGTGLSQMLVAGSELGQSANRGALSMALASVGRFGDARREAAAGRTSALDCGESNVYRSTFARGWAELLDPDGTPSEAEHWFEQARLEASAIGARTMELNASMALARLWHHQGRTREARDLLGLVYAGFTGGFDTPVLNQARVLLDELEAANETPLSAP